MRSQPSRRDQSPVAETDHPLEATSSFSGWRFCQDLIEAFLLPSATPKRLSLGDEWIGTALFMERWHKHYGDAAVLNRARFLAEEALINLNKISGSLGWLDGLTGVAWGIRKLLGTDQDLAEDFSAELDELLARQLNAARWLGYYDLVSGLVGLGLYAIEHPDPKWRRHLTSQVLRQLEVLSETTSAGTTWHRVPELLRPMLQSRYPGGSYDLGVAHGVPGVIGFLARCSELDGCSDLASDLLVGAVKWLLGHKRIKGAISDSDGDQTYFSYSAERSDKSRLAWCYGDLGISFVLLRAAKALGRSDWLGFALQLARNCARRRGPETKVMDMGLCHGSAGVALIFFRLLQQTGDSTFAEASAYWLQRTLDMRMPEMRRSAGVFVMKYSDDGRFPMENMGYLAGAAGVGLAVLTCITGDADRWDAPLLTDLPKHSSFAT